ncbi:uncharacterized protein [Centruroides vittatus]|uniref:uncharacterized protein n=1 Tax=Centruroides vittatus TaxID=120091 RepID=UPI00350E92D8
MAEIERGIRGMEEGNKDYFRWKTTLKSMNQRPRQTEVKQIKRTKRWLADNNLILTRADKSKHLVIMDKRHYVNTLEEYIRNTECERVDQNIIDNLDRKVKKLQKSPITKILSFLKGTSVTGPSVPRLFGFAKTHKDKKQIRPVVEKHKGPTYKLEKNLHRYLSEHIENNQYVTKNPLNVVNDLQNISLVEEEIASVMDFENLYPSIKLDACFQALVDTLSTLDTRVTAYPEDMKLLADLICYHSVFAFDGKIYKQKKGVPMGSPMSGLLCELVIRKLEQTTIRTFKDDIVLYKRYVDDILIVWKKDEKIQHFLNAMNSNNHGLMLKLEQLSTTEVHFLDISVTFKEGSLSTKVYIKPTHDPLYIPSTSNDPPTYKLSAFRAIIRRAFAYCSNVYDRIQELNRIRTIAKTLGFKKSIVENLINSYITPNKKKPKGNANGEITKFTYREGLSTIMKEIAKCKNAKLIYKRAPTIYSALRNDKDSTKADECSGVYKIPYENDQLDLNKEYIGVTNRGLNKRLKEHMYDISKGHCTTTLSKMAQTEGSVINWNEAKVIQQVRSPSLALTMEKFEIYKSGTTGRCLNYKDATNLPTAWKFMIDKHPI